MIFFSSKLSRVQDGGHVSPGGVSAQGGDALPPGFEPPNLRTTTWQKCEAIARRARVEGSYTCVSLNTRPRVIKKRRERSLPSRHAKMIRVLEPFPDIIRGGVLRRRFPRKAAAFFL